jgi:sensor histidine kinase YesM
MEEYGDGFLIGIIFLVVDLLLKVFLLQSELSKNTEKMESRKNLVNMEMVNLVRGELITISIFALDMALPESGNYEILLDMIAIYFQFFRFLEIYSSITILLITYKYKNYVNLFNFISKIFVMLHFFVISVLFRPFLCILLHFCILKGIGCMLLDRSPANP